MQFCVFFNENILLLNTHLLDFFSINGERREKKEQGAKSVIRFVRCCLKRIIEASPSTGMDFLSVLQPLHISVCIRHLDGQFDFVAFCHLVGRIQLSQERWTHSVRLHLHQCDTSV